MKLGYCIRVIDRAGEYDRIEAPTFTEMLTAIAAAKANPRYAGKYFVCSNDDNADIGFDGLTEDETDEVMEALI